MQCGSYMGDGGWIVWRKGQGGVGIGISDRRLVGGPAARPEKKKWTSLKISQNLGMKTPNDKESLN